MSGVEARNARTALVIPVPVAEAVAVRAWITLLDPFLPLAQIEEGVLDELEEFFAGVTPFALVLGEPARFPDGPTYLPPQPVAVLRRIIAELRRDFPELLAPTSGPSSLTTTLEASVPHVLVPDGTTWQPTRTYAREARLLLRDRDDQLLATFAFGTSAA